MSESWANEVVEALRQKLRNPTHSFRTIARDLNAEFGLALTRSAISGKVARLGLVKVTPKLPKIELPSAPKIARPKAYGVAVNAGGEAYAILQSLRKKKPVKPPRRPTPTNFDDDMRETRVHLLKARDGQCRWPAADDGSATMVCGAEVEIGSYCPEHRARAYRTCYLEE